MARATYQQVWRCRPTSEGDCFAMGFVYKEVVDSEGRPFTGVLEIVELGGAGSFLGQTLCEKQLVHVFLDPCTQLSGFRRVTVFSCPVIVHDDGPPKLVQGADTTVFLHEDFRPDCFGRVRETCVGIGALGVGLRHLGLEICAQNDLQAVTCREAALVSHLQVIEGDINSDATVIALWNRSPGDAMLAAGVSCQPYSRLGDRMGEDDPRSASLGGVLRAAYLLQSSAVLLECVEPAATHPFVQASIDGFCQATGFHCAQVVLPLHLVWAAKRTRWWALLTSPDIGQVALPPWKAHGPWHAVEDVLECLNVTPSEAQQLALTEREVSLFQELQPLSAYCLRRNQPLPTALHSWGSPLSPCPCGCRLGPFSWSRLQKGGICSVVVPFEEEAGQGLRYLSAAEVSLLNGLSPATPFGSDCRLSLALVGQLASPLQSAWVTVPLLNRLREMQDNRLVPLDALQVLHGQRRLLLSEAEAFGFRPSNVSGILSGAARDRSPALCTSTACLPPPKKRRLPQVSGEVKPVEGQTGLRAFQAPVAASGQVALASLSSTVVDFLFPGTAVCPTEPGIAPTPQEISTAALHVSQPEPSTLFGLGGLGGLDLCPTRACMPCRSHLAFPGGSAPASLPPGRSAAPVLELTSKGRGANAASTSHAERFPQPPPLDRGLGGLGPGSGREGRHLPSTSDQPTELAGVRQHGPGLRPALPPGQTMLLPGSLSIQVLAGEPVLHALRRSCQTLQLPSFGCYRPDGELVPLASAFPHQTTLQLWIASGADSSAALNPLEVRVSDWVELVKPALTAQHRLSVLELQGLCLADDQVTQALALIAGGSSNVCVIDPLLALQAVSNSDPDLFRPFCPALGRGTCFVTAVPVEGHWVTYSWRMQVATVQAWDSAPRGICEEAISAVSKAFAFLRGPTRPPVVGVCGHFALADLWAHIQKQQPGSCEDALAVSATFAAAFELSLCRDSLVRAPCLLGAGAGDLIEKGLASFLRDRGVPGDQASHRASQAAARLGHGPVQTALGSKNPWRALKHLGNNASPPFQFVLPDELAAGVAARANGPDPLSKKRKALKSKVNSLTAPVAPPPVTQLRVPEGVFADAQSRPLPQIELQSIGPSSTGIVLVTPAQAEPYLKLSRPVSQGALALLIVGDFDSSQATVKVQEVRFRAELVSTGAPLLVAGTLAQIGNAWVDKFVPTTTPVDVAQSSVVRLAIYRDSFPVLWDKFIQSPLREIVAQVPLLQTCSTVGCECQKWHGVAAPGDPPAILENWSRQYFSDTFKVVAPSSAQVFNILLRVPAALEGQLQPISGQGGVFVEPRAEGQRMPSPHYSVMWLPKATFEEARLMVQTHDFVLGLARMASKFGLRCRKSDEEKLHALLHPSGTWVDRAKLRLFETGPWPHGTQRQAIAKALTTFGWRARPVQPCPGHKGGVWYTVESEGAPPQESLHADFGEVLFHEVPVKAPSPNVPPAVLASQRTLRDIRPALSSTAVPDPLQLSDPWQQALNQRPGPSKGHDGPTTSAEAIKSLESSILNRVRNVQPAAASTAELEASILAKVDSRIAAAQEGLQSQIGTLDGKIQTVSSKVDSQESLLQNLFQQQMSRIEELIGATKKGRQE